MAEPTPPHDPRKEEKSVPDMSTKAPNDTQPDKGSKMPPQDAPAVRFASSVEEITPTVTTTSPTETHSPVDAATGPGAPSLSEVTPDDLRALSKSLQGEGPLHERKMNVFGFEPYSLPASRVCSREDESDNSRLPTPSSSGPKSPRFGPAHPMQSPPLTPAGSDPSDPAKKGANSDDGQKAPHGEPQVITPQASSSHDRSPPTTNRQSLPVRIKSGENVPQRSASAEDHDHDARSHRKGLFSIGPGGSVPVSRESSPSRASMYYSKPMTPGGDANDPYAAHKRQPPAPAPQRGAVESRFQFQRRKNKHGSPSGSTSSLGRADKRHSGLLGNLKGHGDELQVPQDDSASITSRPGSFADLKRFFKVGGHHKAKREASPSSVRSGTKTPPTRSSQPQLPFGDDHGLTSKYGKLGRVLGSGAGGSVRLMKRSEDGVVFAVKEFRPRHTYETEKEYVKKLTAEFCVGSTLHHGNVIETLDIVQEKGKWYEVMEFAPYDLFACVMTGKMTREEVGCCFLQILNGVTYLHSMGLAHRDLKLDNVVYPFESDIVLASGIVGSDPYLAPEVYDERKYDPQAVDIWSLAIIYCCMTLRRFPWKLPRMTDNSFKLFAAEPTPGHDPKKLVMPSKSANDLSNTPQRDIFEDGKHERQHHHHKSEPKDKSEPKEKEGESNATASNAAQTGQQGQQTDKKEVIRGPWRILRLLPRESRHIIGRMLEIKVKDRAKMQDILDEPWVANTIICQQPEPGRVIHAEDHVHTLEPPAAPK
ncbi:Serine/threonine-protein kinase oca2 [Colletotrichum orbiculare MAFF 240422]|uniref:non-specific serine/threonine protein kinase n=1 Tax=Colletotrichum orbiculare (strain 104-T / ATCC 96160 / CBS 514.97 / LARS 414 / MAFF 240422) TaxID=1213857 RepID=A0A484FAE8_COLOR|nr:Serine/threonine-protein kinase oca2 [Colletotrichum orbiculare MAFF 240422]